MPVYTSENIPGICDGFTGTNMRYADHFYKACSWKSKLAHVVRYDVYWDKFVGGSTYAMNYMICVCCLRKRLTHHKSDRWTVRRPILGILNGSWRTPNSWEAMNRQSGMSWRELHQTHVSLDLAVNSETCLYMHLAGFKHSCDKLARVAVGSNNTLDKFAKGVDGCNNSRWIQDPGPGS